MTTAHRATWKAARGGLQEEGSFRLHVPSAAVSSKDAPTERELKLRQVPEPLSRGQLRARLTDQLDDPGLPSIEERPSKRTRTHSRFATLPHADQQLSHAPHTPSEYQQNSELAVEQRAIPSLHYTDGGTSDNPEVTLGDEQSADDEDGGAVSEEEHDVVGKGDASDSEAQSDSDEEEDEAELLAEVERIRRERELERAKTQAEQQERIQREEEDRIINDNPLLSNMSSALRDEFSDTASMATGSVAFSVRRRWDDDVVFRNQARKEHPRSARFINDTVHNDFHKRFMKKYIR